MIVEEEMKILEKINKEIIQKGRLLYSYEIKEILDQFIVEGEWIKHDTWDYSCSLCDAYSFADDGNVEELPNFCPNCGAKMKLLYKKEK